MGSFEKVVLVGATSELGTGILRRLDLAPCARILLIGRTCPVDFTLGESEHQVTFVKSDLMIEDDLRLIQNEIGNFGKIDLAIIASGYLPKENKDEDYGSIKLALLTNSLGVISVLSFLAQNMLNSGGGKLVLLSSIAVVRPRSRNFTYSSSKISSDFFARGLASKYRLQGLEVGILRFGFVHSKMTRGMKAAPFAVSLGKACSIAARMVDSKSRVRYVPRHLFFIAQILRIMPRSLADRW